MISCGVLQISVTSKAFALDPNKFPTQYIHDVWTTNEGLPQDTVSSITQDGDGYIWFHTQEGLVKFDGVQFTVLDRNTEAFKKVSITTTFTDSKGTLWIGGGNGLLSYYKGIFSFFGKENGLWSDHNVKRISEDVEGNLWFTYNGEEAGLGKLKNGEGRILTVNDGLASNKLSDIFPDKNGNLWIGTNKGLNLLKDGNFTLYCTANGLSDNLTTDLYGDRDGNIWVGTTQGLNRFKDGKFTVYTTKDGLSSNFISSLHEDRNGILWIGTDHGLNQMIGGKIRTFKGVKGLENDQILTIAEDAEGSLWFGLRSSGLHRLRDGKFKVYSLPEGLLGTNVRGIFETADGRILIGTDPGGLNILSNGKFTHYSTSDGLVNNKVQAVFEDQDGAIWIGTAGGLSRFKDGKFTTFTSKDGLTNDYIISFYQARDGSLWIGTDRGLTQYINDKFMPLPNFEEFRTYYPQAITEDRSGQIWVGMNDFTGYFKDGSFSLFRPDEFNNTNVKTILEDDDGTLWFGGWENPRRLKGEKLTTYTENDGLFDTIAWSILDDGQGNLWMGSNRGVYSVSKKQLDDFAEGKINKVTSKVYGTADGMRKSETNAGSPSALRSRDGRLWFATTDGVAVIDPKRIPTNNVPPPVILEKVLLDEKEVKLEEFTTVSPTAKNLEFRYAGLSFILPAKMKYKYKLEGYDNDWIDAGTRHIAYYTNLPPGDDYEFKVIAANADGIWNEQGAKIKFRVLTPFWKTRWFLSLVLLTIGVIAFLFYRYRISQSEKKQLAQQAFSQQLIESQEKERRRIAAELHDGIGQSLVILKNRATLSLNTPENHQRLLAQMEEISEGASAVISEVRGIARNLHPYQIDFLGLTTALKTMIDGAAEVSNIKFTQTIDEIDGKLSKEAEINLYRIIQEAVNNIIKHSKATEANISLKKNDQTIDLIIEDNGTGFSFDSQNQGRGFGLVGINERANMLNAQVDFNSSPENGTSIYLQMKF